jgi:hypothetical protein
VQSATDLKVAQTFPGFTLEIKCDKSTVVTEPETFESSVKFDILETVVEKLNDIFDDFKISNNYCPIQTYELDKSSDPLLKLVEKDRKIEVPNKVGKYLYKVKATAEGETEFTTPEKTIEVKCGVKSS